MSRERSVKHRIVVLGGGCSGLQAARRMARRAGSEGPSVTLVNTSPYFTERARLHQLAAGQRIRPVALADSLDGTGVEFIRGRAVALDLDRREMRVDSPAGSRLLRYDTLVCATGTTADVDGAPGAAQHALTVTGRDDALQVRTRIAAVAASGGLLVVVGGGAGAIEVATELAETHPRLRVRMLTEGEPGDWLSPRARCHVYEAFDRLGIDVRLETVVEVRAGGVALADRRIVAADAVLWTAGLHTPPLAGEAGLRVDMRGRVLVDATLRSLSHPDVYAVGDAAAVFGPGPAAAPMGCAGQPSGRYAADVISDRLAGRSPQPLRFGHLMYCLSLGRSDALIQFVRADQGLPGAVLTGRLAVRVREAAVRKAARVAHRPRAVRRPMRGHAVRSGAVRHAGRMD
jgi:NADH dehydrogenase FAD-containing subunit